MSISIQVRKPAILPQSLPLDDACPVRQLFNGVSWFGYLEYYHPEDAEVLKATCLDKAREAVEKLVQFEESVTHEQNPFRKKELIEERFKKTIRAYKAVMLLRAPLQPLNLSMAFDDEIEEKVVGSTYSFSVKPRHNTDVSDVLRHTKTHSAKNVANETIITHAHLTTCAYARP